MAWTQPALQLTQDNGKVMGSQESGSASCRAYWTGWERQSQKSDKREAQMNSGCISRTLFSEPRRSWGAVQGHQTETQALTVVSAEAETCLSCQRGRAVDNLEDGGRTAHFVNAFWKRKQYYSFEKVVLTFCGHDLSHYPWGNVHRHPNMAFGETFPPCITIPGNPREVETQTLETCPSWPRLNVQGEAKTQFLATNSAETMDVSPTGSGVHPILPCQPEHQKMPDV